MALSARHKEAVRKHSGNITVALIIYAILISIVFLIVYPLLAYVSDMFKSMEDLMDASVVFLPKEPNTYNIKLAIEGLSYWKSMGNSAILCLLVSSLQMTICTLVGYGFARYKFPLKKVAFALVVFTMLVPTPLLMPSLYTRFSHFDILGIFAAITGQPLRLLDSMWPFAIMSFFALGYKNGLYIFIVRQFFRNMPKELEESGRIDGAGFIRIFFSIMLPNAITMVITVFLFSFSWQWTDQYWSSMFFINYKVLPKALAMLVDFGNNYIEPVTKDAMVHTGIILVIIPILIMYLLLQRFFIQGISRSGIVG